ncbi:MAG: caspase family protein [Cytophagales bacterium]|nr:caspase family protein [Cytophagales bacterium]
MKKALLVGINDYDWAPLNGCASDAIAMAKVLGRNYDQESNFACKVIISDREKNHYDIEDIPVFINHDVKRSNLRKAVEELFSDPSDVALFYFSGHGHESDMGGSLVTTDAKKYDEGVAIVDILRMANSATHIREIILILDCCHSGQLGNLPDYENNRALLRKGISILTASTAEQVARERNGHGVFTSVLIEGLLGGAANLIGNVTSASLYNFADKALGAFEQRPVYKSHVISLRTIRRSEPQLTIQEIREIPKIFPQIDHQKFLDKSYEPAIEPRDRKNELEYKLIQKFIAASLVKPSSRDHIYYEAIENGSCELTALGKLYWRMSKNNRI